jgi:cytidylate kinase
MLRISTDPDDFWVSADGDDVTAEIRTRAVTNAVSAVSAVPAVRARLIDEQRKIIDAGGIVVEGRDIGTVVAPDAQAKFFLTASSAERAVRRAKQLDGPQVPESAVRLTRAEIDRRDRLDSSFTPTPRAADAMVLDSTALTADEVVEQVLRLAKVR